MANTEAFFGGEKKLRTTVAILAAGALALTGCGEKEEINPASAEATATSQDAQSPRLTFDDLGAGDPVIQVYPGVGEAANDRVANGTYNVGDSVVAECKTEGRIVNSNPSIGEESRTSDMWVRIQGTPGETQYATAVYAEDPNTLLRQLPEC